MQYRCSSSGSCSSSSSSSIARVASAAEPSINKGALERSDAPQQGLIDHDPVAWRLGMVGLHRRMASVLRLKLHGRLCNKASAACPDPNTAMPLQIADKDTWQSSDMPALCHISLTACPS